MLKLIDMPACKVARFCHFVSAFIVKNNYLTACVHVHVHVRVSSTDTNKHLKHPRIFVVLPSRVNGRSGDTAVTQIMDRLQDSIARASPMARLLMRLNWRDLLLCHAKLRIH
jgi:hypothetical protein